MCVYVRVCVWCVWVGGGEAVFEEGTGGHGFRGRNGRNRRRARDQERAARCRMALASVLLMQALLACAGGKAGRESSAASASG